MARVAANQDSSEAARLHYVYLQHAHVISRRGSTVRCEETTDARITPAEGGSSQQLLTLNGRLLRKGKYVTYDKLRPRRETGSTNAKADEGQDTDVQIDLDSSGQMDRDLVENMRASLTNAKSKDGIAAGLFPLTSKNQTDYSFRLLGREPMNGRDTYHIAFSPKKKDDYGWKGDAWIDASAFEPVVVRTTMAKNVPFAVRTLLGTSFPGLGFSVIYAPQPGGVWFPTSFGTEFKIRVLFFFARQIIVNAENRDFAETHVSSRIVPDSISSPAPDAQPGPQP